MTTRLPSGLKIAFHTLSVWPPRGAIGWPVTPSHSQTVWSWDAETMRRPSGPNATDRIVFLWPRIVGDLPARRRIPQAYGIVRIHTSRDQARPVGTEGQGPWVLDIAAQDGDLLAGYRIP